VHYQRNADFRTKTLLDVTGTIPILISTDPFFVHISWHEEEESEEEAEAGFERLQLEGLKYEKLEIKELEWRVEIVTAGCRTKRSTTCGVLYPESSGL
jgi:hypothetical protein